MSIGLGVEAAQVSRFAGLPVRRPRVFGEVLKAQTTLASLGSIAPGLQEAARGHFAFTPSPASMALPTPAGGSLRAGGLRPGPGRFPRPLSASPRRKK
jgi:hypothetical protein